MLKYTSNITGEDILYLHFQKTGGFSFYNIINQKGIEQEYFMEHRGYINIPDEYSNIRKIGFIRNPYSWYVSFYFFHMGKPDSTRNFDLGSLKTVKPNTAAIRDLPLKSIPREFNCSPFVEALTMDKKSGFDQFVRNASNLKDFFQNNPHMYEFFIIRMKSYIEFGHSWYSTWFKNADQFQLELKVEDMDMSLMQWYANVIGVSNAEVEVFKLENFKDVITSEFGSAFVEPHKNSSEHSEFRHYYNEETSGMIYLADKAIFDKFNYNQLHLK